MRAALGTRAARNLATTTKTRPHARGASPRWLLRALPWVDAPGGVYRVNRRSCLTPGGRLTFTGPDFRVVPGQLSGLGPLRGFEDEAVLTDLANRFVRHEYAAGELIATAGQPADRLVLIAHGKVDQVVTGKFGDATSLGVLTEGHFVGERVLAGAPGRWSFTMRAITRCVVLALPSASVDPTALRAHLAAAVTGPPRNKAGETDVALTSGHHGEPRLAGTFVDYELHPREYRLAVAQTVLRVHTRVSDVHSDPMDQVREQLRLTIDALRERQEHDLVNDPSFGLLSVADPRHRIPTRTGPPTPDDLDDLLCRRRGTRCFVAHPMAIAAFGRECSRHGLAPGHAELDGRVVPAWRNVPLLPCDKVPVRRDGTTSILAMRTGEDDEGVVGLHQTGIPDEVEPGLSVRFMGGDDAAISSYLVNAYYSIAVLVPDALGVLDDVQVQP